MRSRLILIAVATGLVLTASSARAQPRSTAPAIDARPGGFTARRLSAKPSIDGTEWLETPCHVAGDGTTNIPVASPIGTYTWRMEHVDGALTGDFDRDTQAFVAPGGTAVVMDELAAWIYISPDGRYVFREVLTVLDVVAWRQHDLSAAFGIRNYTFVLAISKDARRLLVESRSCSYDCKPDFTYYELTRPR